MSKLYTDLAHVYDQIYQTIFDYDAEFKFYHEYLTKNEMQSVLEIGCGTGNLARQFINSRLTYQGLDISEKMIELAIAKNPSGSFHIANICDTYSEFETDSVIISGRTISYLISNSDLLQAFENIHKSLKKDGLLIFDAIDAEALFLKFKFQKEDILEVSFEETQYKRISNNKENLLKGWTWDWESTYFKKNQNNEYEKIGDDFATLRAFTQDEIVLFLKLSGFELLEIIPKESYAWKDHFFVAKKK